MNIDPVYSVYPIDNSPIALDPRIQKAIQDLEENIKNLSEQMQEVQSEMNAEEVVLARISLLDPESGKILSADIEADKKKLSTLSEKRQDDIAVLKYIVTPAPHHDKGGTTVRLPTFDEIVDFARQHHVIL